jgi:1-acyl-sn-glycerol-3-phosphate acyltransferase
MAVVRHLGYGAGTLYIERENRKDAMRMVKEMTRALNNGDVLAVFQKAPPVMAWT